MGRSEYTSMHLHKDHKEWITRFAQENDISRSKAIAFCIDRLRREVDSGCDHIDFHRFCQLVRLKLPGCEPDESVLTVCYDVMTVK